MRPTPLVPRLRSAAAVAAAFVVAAAVPALAGDLIYTTDGKVTGYPRAGNPPSESDFEQSTIEVVEENLDKVVYRLEGVPTPQTIETARVRAIHHDPSSIPADLQKGRALLARDDYDGAREALEKVAASASEPGWARAEAAYHAAVSFAYAGDNGGAEAALSAFKNAFPKSRYVTQATEQRAKALLALDRVDDARGEFASAKKLPGAGEDVQIESDYWLAWIDEQVATRKGDAAGLATAQKAYEALINRLQGKSQYESMLRRCQAGRAACMIATGKAADALKDLERLAGDTKDRRALAGIHTKLGLATLRAAPAGDKAAQKRALQHYLRVVVLYGDEPGAEEDCAESMYSAGLLFRDLKDTAPDYPSRARRELNEVVQRFPGSVWAQRAKEALVSR